MGRPYRLLVTGSRDWGDAGAVEFELASLSVLHPEGVTVVHGACPRGVDAMADAAARRLGLAVERHPADWDAHGKAAGFRRNQAMVDLGADVCLAFLAPCGKPGCRQRQPHPSHGADHCATAAAKAGIPVRRFTP